MHLTCLESIYLFFTCLSHLQHLIDLAGSESSRAETTGVRRKEGSYINKSLLTLGTVRLTMAIYINKKLKSSMPFYLFELWIIWSSNELTFFLLSQFVSIWCPSCHEWGMFFSNNNRRIFIYFSGDIKTN